MPDISWPSVALGVLIVVLFSGLGLMTYGMGKASQRSETFQNCVQRGTWQDVDGTVYDCTFAKRGFK